MTRPHPLTLSLSKGSIDLPLTCRGFDKLSLSAFDMSGDVL